MRINCCYLWQEQSKELHLIFSNPLQQPHQRCGSRNSNKVRSKKFYQTDPITGADSKVNYNVLEFVDRPVKDDEEKLSSKILTSGSKAMEETWYQVHFVLISPVRIWLNYLLEPIMPKSKQLSMKRILS